MSKTISATTPIAQRRWLRVSSAARYLDCTPRHVRNLIATGAIRSYRRGNVVWVDGDNLDAFIEAGARTPDEAA